MQRFVAVLPMHSREAVYMKLLHAVTEILAVINLEATYMQFLVARSLWINLSWVRYSMPLAIWEHITVRRFFTSSTCSVKVIQKCRNSACLDDLCMKHGLHKNAFNVVVSSEELKH